MAVAKSYENMKILCEPYHYDNDPKKLYVRVQGPCKRCGGSGHYSYNQIDGTMCLACRGSGKEVKEVRWYSEGQRAAMDRAAEKRAAEHGMKMEANRIRIADRNAFGFGEKGYITIFKGDQNVINEWAHETTPCRARFNMIFKWFVPSSMTYENLPASITPIVVKWEDVRDTNDKEDIYMRDHEEIKKYIISLITEPTKSQYQGQPGDWLEKDVTIVKVVNVEGYMHQAAKMYIMEDNDENVYVWATSSKTLEEKSTYHMRMKVKEHKEYNNVKQTVVYYCKVKG